jgi:UDP-N-acetylmuramate: L-alanyl-gamma-D-glutamyl-meso-diaminopimelate ligase
MKVHLIAIGGSAMHNLAIAMHKKGYLVTGSDDEIVEPSKSRLANHGLLPLQEGWFDNKITSEIDAVILGMHARKDNPELLKAQELGLPIYSYPGYIYEQSKEKTRVVIGGSHGKTSITAMILHVLNATGMDCDYLVGAQLKGFDTMVRITAEAPRILLEGDEYLASPIEPFPKFHLYHPHIALLSGVAWDHINVFPTFENYVEQFQIFADKIEPNGSLIYFEGDDELVKIANNCRSDIHKKPYREHPSVIENGTTFLIHEQDRIPLKIFGKHNLQNLQGALLVCMELGVSRTSFYQAIQSFTGAAKRLELVFSNAQTNIFKDFAHSPSKLKATTDAVREQFPNRKLIACMELHTFSSLNQEFLEEYKDSMKKADKALVYFNPHTVAHKKLSPISTEQVKAAFGSDNVQVYNDSKVLIEELQKENWEDANLLMMSSGNFDGLKFEELAGMIGLI